MTLRLSHEEPNHTKSTSKKRSNAQPYSGTTELGSFTWQPYLLGQLSTAKPWSRNCCSVLSACQILEPFTKTASAKKNTVSSDRCKKAKVQFPMSKLSTKHCFWLTSSFGAFGPCTANDGCLMIAIAALSRAAGRATPPQS